MFIAEPVQGAGGVIVPQDDYFPRIREICDRYQILLVADEVITGFGRTGKMFALNHWNIEPDIIQFAKAITSGYFPFGGIGINDAIADTLEKADTPWMHAYTYSAHPIGCAVALRMLQLINEEGFPEQAETKGRRLLHGLRSALADHEHVGDIRGKGLMCAVELVENRETKKSFPDDQQVGIRVNQAAIAGGLFSRVKGDSYLLAPPVITTDSQLDQIVDILTKAIRTILG